MIICSFCQHTELVGAVYCSQCGMLLSYQQNSPASTDFYPQDKVNEAEPLSFSTAAEALPPSQAVYLKLHSSGRIIPLESGIEFTLGRVSGDQPILPDIDLSSYQAYELGVSRLHATIKISGSEITITDLGSANSTLVNGVNITAHEPHKLCSGDRIELGKLKLQIVIQRKSLS